MIVSTTTNNYSISHQNFQIRGSFASPLLIATSFACTSGFFVPSKIGENEWVFNLVRKNSVAISYQVNTKYKIQNHHQIHNAYAKAEWGPKQGSAEIQVTPRPNNVKNKDAYA